MQLGTVSARTGQYSASQVQGRKINYLAPGDFISLTISAGYH